MAAKHMVICVRCGKRFDANLGASYDSTSRRYTCKQCVRQHNAKIRKARAEIRKEQTGMTQTLGAMIAKIATGIIFVLAGFSSPDGGWSIGYFLTALVTGGALIAWGLIPYLQARKAKQITEEEKTVGTGLCASCGAPLTTDTCEYCGRKHNT